MQKILISVLLLISFTTASWAKIIFLPDTISTKTKLDTWNAQIKQIAITELMQFKNDAFGYTQCKKTTENKQVILCGTYLQRDMNAFLLRAAIFAEGGIGGHAKQALIANNDKHIAAHLDVIGGHDLASTDLIPFYQKTLRLCEQGKKLYCLTQAENEFYQAIIQPLIKTNREFVVISFSVQSASTPEEIVSHEFIHAIYFLNPDYKTKISEFWQNEMNAQERMQIKTALGNIGYNTQNEDLMRNEFQAYILMHDAQKSLLGQFIHSYRSKLQLYIHS